MTNICKKYIFWFAQEHLNFRKAEIFSIIKLFNINLKTTDADSQKPFWIVELPGEEEAKKIASRSVSLRCILELWAHSTTASTLHENIRSYIKNKSNNVSQFFKPDKNFRITVETYNKHFSQKEKIEKIESFAYLPLTGSVELKNPDIHWWYIEFWGLSPQEVPEFPLDVLFGRWVIDGQRCLIKELSLKKRKFIGNTSMDAQLSLLMANQAMVKKGDFVFDPFVGSGSLLVSAAKFGGYVLGSDIDFLMVHAKSRPSRITQKIREKDEKIRANLKQYGCDEYYIDVVVSDFSNSIWRDQIIFDSIITDPPYGIREATEKIESKTYAKLPTKSDNVPHYPSTSHYSLQCLYEDLLEFSAKHLRVGGRLVSWLPVFREDYNEDLIPKHENLILVSNSEQLLSGMTSRRLLTYEKVSELNQDTFGEVSNVRVQDFRSKYFSYGEETRAERRTKRAELREIGRMEALKRGKQIDENGKVVNNKNHIKYIAFFCTYDD